MTFEPTCTKCGARLNFFINDEGYIQWYCPVLTCEENLNVPTPVEEEHHHVYDYE